MAIQKIVTDDALSAFASDVKTAIANVSSPLVYKGTLGTGGTISTLPAASASNNGFAYVVITAGTYQGVVCAVGDVIASNGTAWNIIPQANSAETLPITNGSAVNTKEYIDDKTTLVKSASGSLIHITDGGDNIPLKSCEVTIDPDLSGKTECNLVFCGKNLFEVTATTQTKNNITFTVNANGTVTANNTANGTSVLILGTITLNQGNYTLNGTDTNGGQGKYGLGLYDENDTLLNTDFGSGITFTVTEKTTYKIGIRYWYGITYSNVLFSPMLRPSSITDGTFEKYNGTIYNIPFGQTVYGGSGNALTGEFVSEWGKYTITNDTILNTYNTSEYGSWARVSQIGAQKIDNTNIMAFCDIATGIPFNRRTASLNERRVYTDDTGYVVIRAAATDNITSLEDLKNLFMGANICYALATPTSLTLSGVAPKTLSGINNIYSNCGDVEVTYYTYKSNDILEFVDSEIGKKNGTNIPIEENSQDSIKDYVDGEISSTKDYVDNGLNDKVAYKSGEVVYSNYVTGAYVSGSGNYVEFCIPINTKATSGTITNLGTNLNVFIGNTRLTNEVTLAGSSVVAIKDGYAQVELKLNSTQTANSVATVSLDGFTVNFA